MTWDSARGGKQDPCFEGYTGLNLILCIIDFFLLYLGTQCLPWYWTGEIDGEKQWIYSHACFTF